MAMLAIPVFIRNPLFGRALEVVERRPIWVKGEMDHFRSSLAQFIQEIV
jgi:hypothetical protein